MTKTTAHNAPEAQVVGRSATHITILCPYCGDRHNHERTLSGYQRRAPGCGLVRTPEQRWAGYWYVTR